MTGYSAYCVSPDVGSSGNNNNYYDRAFAHGVARSQAHEQRITALCLLTGATMTEQSQMPLVGPPKRRGWREIVRFRPLTASTNAALVVTRRGRLVSILPA